MDVSLVSKATARRCVMLVLSLGATCFFASCGEVQPGLVLASDTPSEFGGDLSLELQVQQGVGDTWLIQAMVQNTGNGVVWVTDEARLIDNVFLFDRENWIMVSMGRSISCSFCGDECASLLCRHPPGFRLEPGEVAFFVHELSLPEDMPIWTLERMTLHVALLRTPCTGQLETLDREIEVPDSLVPDLRYMATQGLFVE